jgi:hypothetical protein
VQGLHLVLIVVEDLVGSVDLGLTERLLVGLLLGVHFSALDLFQKCKFQKFKIINRRRRRSTYLVVFELFDSLRLLSLALGLDGIWPLADPGV